MIDQKKKGLIHDRDSSEELSFSALRRLKFSEVSTKQLGHDLREALVYGLEKHVRSHGIIEEIILKFQPYKAEGGED